jgi:hypothetical protein
MDNELANKVYNQNLNSMGLPMNKLNGMLTNLQSLMVCDTECRKRKHADLLKKKWNDAKDIKKNINQNIEDAEKKYFSFVEGEFGYKQALLERYKKIAEKNKTDSVEAHELYLKELNRQLSSYTALSDTYKKIIELKDIRENENKHLLDTIDKETAHIQTNDRRVVYEDWDTQQLGTIHSFLFYIYYISLIIFLVYGPLFREKMYKKPLYVIYIITLVILPYLIQKISILIIQLYKKAFNILPVIKES